MHSLGFTRGDSFAARRKVRRRAPFSITKAEETLRVAEGRSGGTDEGAKRSSRGGAVAHDRAPCRLLSARGVSGAPPGGIGPHAGHFSLRGSFTASRCAPPNRRGGGSSAIAPVDPWGSAVGGPPPGPAFGTSSVPPPVSGAGPAAATDRRDLRRAAAQAGTGIANCSGRGWRNPVPSRGRPLETSFGGLQQGHWSRGSIPARPRVVTIGNGAHRETRRGRRAVVPG